MPSATERCEPTCIDKLCDTEQQQQYRHRDKEFQDNVRFIFTADSFTFFETLQPHVRYLCAEPQGITLHWREFKVYEVGRSNRVHAVPDLTPRGAHTTPALASRPDAGWGGASPGMGGASREAQPVPTEPVPDAQRRRVLRKRWAGASLEEALGGAGADPQVPDRSRRSRPAPLGPLVH